MKKLNLDIQRFASTNKTANYDLPQFVGTDKPTWLGDFNQAMFDIDAGMHANATDIESAETIAQNASASASQASQDVAGLTSTVNTLSSDVTSATTTANNAQQTATSALNTANTANGKADTNASDISTLSTNLSALETQVSDLDGTILWENSSKSSSFASQTITLSSSDYDLYEIIFRISSDSSSGDDYSRCASSGLLLKGYGTRASVTYAGSHGVNVDSRVVSVSTNTTLSFASGYSASGSTAWVQNDYLMVPLYVIGYNTGLFD